jgi:hypothetical protein
MMIPKTPSFFSSWILGYERESQITWSPAAAREEKNKGGNLTAAPAILACCFRLTPSFLPRTVQRMEKSCDKEEGEEEHDILVFHDNNIQGDLGGGEIPVSRVSSVAALVVGGARHFSIT